jgi:hypothetical protein
MRIAICRYHPTYCDIEWKADGVRSISSGIENLLYRVLFLTAGNQEEDSALIAGILECNPSDGKQEGNDAHLAVLSPACKLPDDVARTIFMATLPSTRTPGVSPNEAPLLLVRIWKPWRDIALQTPRLWASIHIVLTSLATIPRTEVVTNWLNRSGALPVDICLLPSKRLRVQTKKTESPQSRSISLLLSALIQTSRRWRNIRFFLSKNDAEPCCSSSPSRKTTFPF